MSLTDGRITLENMLFGTPTGCLPLTAEINKTLAVGMSHMYGYPLESAKGTVFLVMPEKIYELTWDLSERPDITRSMLIENSLSLSYRTSTATTSESSKESGGKTLMTFMRAWAFLWAILASVGMIITGQTAFPKHWGVAVFSSILFLAALVFLVWSLSSPATSPNSKIKSTGG